MEDTIKIKYYVDLINSIQVSINENENRLIEYEKLIIQEKTQLARLSFWVRLFSGRKKLISDFCDSVNQIQLSIDNYKDELERKKNEMVSIAVNLLEADDKKMQSIYNEYDLYFKINTNLETIKDIIKKSSFSLSESKKLHKKAKENDSGEYCHLSYPIYEKSLNLLLSSINEIKSLHKLIDLKDYISCEQHVSEFKANFKTTVDSLIAHEKSILNIRTHHRQETNNRGIADARVLKTRLELITFTETLLSTLSNMVNNEAVIFNYKYKNYEKTINISNVSRESYVMAQIREKYGLKVF